MGNDENNNVIYSAQHIDLLRLYRTSSYFREAVATGKYVYVDGVICLFTPESVELVRGEIHVCQNAKERPSLFFMGFSNNVPQRKPKVEHFLAGKMTGPLKWLRSVLRTRFHQETIQKKKQRAKRRINRKISRFHVLGCFNAKNAILRQVLHIVQKPLRDQEKSGIHSEEWRQEDGLASTQTLSLFPLVRGLPHGNDTHSSLYSELFWKADDSAREMYGAALIHPSFASEEDDDPFEDIFKVFSRSRRNGEEPSNEQLVFVPDNANRTSSEMCAAFIRFCSSCFDRDQSFGDTLKYYMQENSITENDLAEEVGISCRQLRRLRNGKARPTFEMLVALCIGLHLEPWNSEILLRAAWQRIPSTDDGKVYAFLLRCCYSCSVAECNGFLCSIGLSPLTKKL